MNNLTFIAVGIILHITFWFLLSIKLKRNDIADIAWGLGFIYFSSLVIFSKGLLNPSLITQNQRLFIVYCLIIIWGLRLCLHIGLRLRSKSEDARYKKWRNEWKKLFYLRSFFQVYVLQTFLMIIICLPVVLLANDPNSNPITPINYFGIAVWAFGFLFETIGDLQLNNFINKKEKEETILTTGLWKYSRHPNYFGEVTLWWGVFLVVIGVKYWLLAILSPLTITFLILKVSGIPMLEKKYEGNVEFEKYKAETRAFFPISKFNN